MAPNQRSSHVLPLETLSLSAVPLTTHNLSWSPDAELAVACDDCVYLFLPEFPSQASGAAGIGPRAGSSSLADLETQRQYFEVSLRFPVVEVRPPELNRALFEQVRRGFPDFEATVGAGQSVVANIGSSMNHAVALDWSPSGLGRMKRSVLGVLTGGGSLVVYCEGVSDGVGSIKIKGRNIRSITSWVAAWGVGGNLLLPRARNYDSPYSKEFVTSFAWARDLDRNGTLLAYMTDEDEIVIVSVQSRHSPSGGHHDAGQWRVEEVARFSGSGPHEKGDPSDPDFSPSGSSFGLRWSPWLQRPGARSAILSYVTKNYVGFRQITIKGTWKSMDTPTIEVQTFDCAGLCLYLAPDAFVAWEDLVWTKGTAKECRGVIATPFTVESFQVAFDAAAPANSSASHSTMDCETIYPPEEQVEQFSNPITGLIIHAPDVSKSTPSPYFSLTRLSATHTNSDWYQTNIPLLTESGDQATRPAWATEISRIVESTQPISQAYRYLNPEGPLDAESEGNNSGNEDDEDDGDGEDGDLSDEEGDSDYDDFDDEYSKAELVGDLQQANDTAAAAAGALERVHTTRVRIWGAAASPGGGGVTAVFATLNSTIRPERHTFAGMRCRVLFGRSLAAPDEDFLATRRLLSTEARAFEWMYGGGPRVSGIGDEDEGIGGGDVEGGGGGGTTSNNYKRQSVRELFKEVAASQLCAFCDGALEVSGSTSRCARRHMFDNCAATGIPILAPGVSNNCGVCGSKCLKPDELASVAGPSMASVTKQISGELCGGCGGKFIN